MIKICILYKGVTISDLYDYLWILREELNQTPATLGDHSTSPSNIETSTFNFKSGAEGTADSTVASGNSVGSSSASNNPETEGNPVSSTSPTNKSETTSDLDLFQQKCNDRLKKLLAEDKELSPAIDKIEEQQKELEAKRNALQAKGPPRTTS